MESMDYRAAGVDVEAGYEAVRRIKKHIDSTLNPNVLLGLGGFGGCYGISEAKGMREPVLVAGADGVGTKLKIAFAMDKHDTVGIDCVAMCVNDIICQGARPLFFLDYIASGKMVPERVEQIVAGVAEGCRQSGCALLGGETAEMPGFYPDGEYDLAGFAVGLADKGNVIDGSRVAEGDVLIGLTSSGLHSNGFSLVRKLVGESKEALDAYHYDLGLTMGEEILRPTRIYAATVGALLKRFDIRGIANITGGGFIENIPRIIPQGLCANVQLGSWPTLPIFGILKQLGNLSVQSLYNTFNMGIGMVLVVPEQDAPALVRACCRELDQEAYVIGEIVRGGERIALCP